MQQPHPGPQALRFDDRAAYRAWAEGQERGRWERQEGMVVAMAPERLRHTRIKYQMWRAFDEALTKAGSSCIAIGDGVTVEVDASNDYEPDMLVTCSPIDDSSVAAPNPVVIVEVLSPSTAYRDITVKLNDYFRLPSLRHYLLVATDAVRVIHHARQADGTLLTAIHGSGPMTLDPPGISVTAADFYRGTDLAPPPDAYTGSPT